MSTVHVLAVAWCMEKKGWRKLIWSGGFKPELMTATESFYLILQLCKIQLSLERAAVEFSWGGNTEQSLSSCCVAFPQSWFSAWPCFAPLPAVGVSDWRNGLEMLPFLGAGGAKPQSCTRSGLASHTSPLRNCLQHSWVCAFGLAGSWPKLWSHEEAYKVYFGSKILGEAGRRLKRILKKWCKWETTSSFILCAIALVCGSK